MSYGFELAGYDIVAGIDSWNDALLTFDNNHLLAKSINADLYNVNPSIILKQIDQKIDVVIGGPPCQGFSIAGKRMIDDKRNILYKSFVDFVCAISPVGFVMENVPNIISMDGGRIKNEILDDFSKLGYKVKVKVLNSSDYGVPQNRKRAFFIGVKNSLNVELEFPNLILEKVTTAEAISDLPKDSLVDGSDYITEPISSYQAEMRKGSKGIFNHQITIHKEQTIEIISQVPDGCNYKSLPTHLHSTRKVNIAWTRMASNKPCFTIDTGHNHHFHYKFNRVPTARESARIQSFPDKFIFTGNKGSQLKQIGNAVPPLLAKAIATSLKKSINV